MKSKIEEKLKDLIKQATEEKSHYYVKSVAEEALKKIDRLRAEVEALKRGIIEVDGDKESIYIEELNCRYILPKDIPDFVEKLKSEIERLEGELKDTFDNKCGWQNKANNYFQQLAEEKQRAKGLVSVVSELLKVKNGMSVYLDYDSKEFNALLARAEQALNNYSEGGSGESET